MLAKYEVDIATGGLDARSRHSSSSTAEAWQGDYDGLDFELPKTTVDALDAEFVRK